MQEKVGGERRKENCFSQFPLFGFDKEEGKEGEEGECRRG